jgi:hypothetical protein
MRSFYWNPRVREIAVALGRKMKRAGDLAGAVMVTGVGAGTGIVAGLQLRLPDTAVAAQTAGYLPMPVSEQRDIHLWMLGVGVAILVWGLHSVEAWFRIGPVKPRVLDNMQ